VLFNGRMRLTPAYRICVICSGNICRSPMGEVILRSMLHSADLDDGVVVDSAGTGASHVGSSPDARASATALTRGVTLRGAARQVRSRDFEEFDLLLAMDSANLRDLRRMARDEQQREKVRLLRAFDPASERSGDLDVPDPYYGGDGGFEEVFDLVHAACEGLLERIRTGAGVS